MESPIGGTSDSVQARLDELERRVSGRMSAEVLSVDPWSAGLVLGVLHALWGLVFGVWRAYTAAKARIETLPPGEGANVQPLQEMVVSGLLLSGIGLVVGFVVGLVLAKLYNAVAGSVGGIRVEVRGGPR
jgi:hypothetical protein